jgi:hypothetical protein
VDEGLELLRGMMARAGYAAAPTAVLGALAHTAPPVPVSLTTAVAKLVADGVGAGLSPVPATGAATSAVLKGGLIVKIGLGVAAAGLVAGTALWAVGGKSEESAKPKAPSAVEGSSAPAPLPGAGLKAADDNARFKLEPVAMCLSQVPVCDGIVAGPGRAAMSFPTRVAGCPYGMDSVVVAADGTMFTLEGDMVRMFGKDGQCVPIFRSATPGFRDGPAEKALSDVWGRRGHYNCRPNMAVDSRNRIYITDNGNGRLRRVFKDKDGKWQVETAAGGGTRVLKDGESAPAGEVELTKGIFHVAMASDELIWIITPVSLQRYTPKDGKVARFRWWSDDWKTYGLKGERPQQFFCYGGPVYDVAGDGRGLAFIAVELNAADMQYYRIDPEGKISFVAGAFVPGPYAGDPKLTHFWTVGSLAAPVGDPFIYMNSGDENVPRRMAKDGSGQVQALFMDGRWRPTPGAGVPNGTYFWSLPNPFPWRKPPADLSATLFTTGHFCQGNDGALYLVHRVRNEPIGSHTLVQKFTREGPGN